MAAIAGEVRASYAFVERNVNLVRRYWGWEVVWLVHSIAHALAVGFIGSAMGTLSSQPIDTQQLTLYLLIGSLVWSYLSISFEAIGDSIGWERWEGTIEYTFMAPVSRLTHMLGTVVFALVYGLARTALILLIVSRFFALDLAHANLLGALAVMLTASVGFVGLGIMAATLPLLFTERGTQMIIIAQSTLLLVSGVYYPLEVMPGWMQAIGRVSPATYTLLGARRALMEGAGVGQLLDLLLPLALVGLLTVPIGLWVFGRAERFAKRTGRLKRSG